MHHAQLGLVDVALGLTGDPPFRFASRDAPDANVAARFAAGKVSTA